ncbi:MAG: protein arginine kinase [Firmicutes bacterium]|nr:protein arginine kinase [Bacillota bacterium]
MNHNQLNEFLPFWVRSDGKSNDVAFSSRIRLARNIKGIPFPNYAKEKDLNAVIEAIKKGIKGKDNFGHLSIIDLEALTPSDRLCLVEKHLCSPQFIEQPHLRSLIVNPEQSISLMVNEEDHLRIQTIVPGFAPDNALNLANQVDDYLEEFLEYCFDENYGYLTACPTNVGTGLRVSIMVHLPGLTIIDQVKKVLTALTHIGINIRGLYGEGTESFGDLYQISNQVTLGHTEVELINNLKSVCRQVIEQERAVREALLKESKMQLEDRVYRAFGVLTHARMLTSQEALKLLSDVKLGIELGIITGIKQVEIKELFLLTRASILQKIAGKELPTPERDYYRAQIIREHFKKAE